MHEKISFFDLPREVRDQILFHYCSNKLVATSKKQLSTLHPGRFIQWMPDNRSNSSDRGFPRRSEDTFALLSALRVSRQFYDEAVTMFYSTSKFRFEDLVPFYLLVDKLPIGYQSLIQELHLDMSTEEVDQWRAMFLMKATYLSGLRNVQIRIDKQKLPRAAFTDVADLQLDSSISLSLLHKTTISIQYRYSEHRSDAVSKEDAEGIAQGLMDGLREGIECQESEKIG